MLLAITGTPATGKTTIGSLLAKRLKWTFVSLNDLAAHDNLYCGYDTKRDVKVVDIEKITEKIRDIKKHQKNIVIESHYAHEIPSDIVIVLRCKPRELRKRMQKKGWSKEKIEENIEAEIMEVCADEARDVQKKVVEFDTTGETPAAVVKEIEKYLRSFTQGTRRSRAKRN